MFGLKNIFKLIAVISFFHPLVASGQLYINEIQAANQSTFFDTDFETYADWIEIYNGYNVAMDLSGFYLTDNEENPEKWKFPEGTIISGDDYLIIWADGENTGLHCNFRLKKSGEHIFFFDTNKDLIDELSFLEQPVDLSFGRTSDGAEGFVFFDTPTPGSDNGGFSFNGLTVQKIQFSVAGGIYTNPQNVELQTTSGNIYYTTDGSIPDQNSLPYNGPITVGYSQVIRARVIMPGAYPGEIFTNSYLINESFEERRLPVISIATNPDHFWHPDFGLYTQDDKPPYEYPVNIEFFENTGDNRAAFNEPAGIKINGNNSWRFPQKILGIYFRDKYGKEELDYPVFPDADRNSFDYLALRASGNDQGSTFIRDGLIQNIVDDNMDLELQRFRPSAVYVNGEYIGLHNIRSKQNEAYLEHYFDLDKGDYDLILNNGEVDEGDDIDFQELMNLFSQDLSIESNFDALEEIMDMENMIHFFITELWASNRSWGHNIKLWKPKTANGKWRWILKDLDRGFYGADNNGINYFSDVGISPSDYEWARVIMRSLLTNENFKNSFFKIFADHLYVTFHPVRISPLIAEMKKNIENEIPFHLSVWGGVTADYGDALPSLEHWYNEILDLESFAIDRAIYLREDFRNAADISPLVNFGLICYPERAGSIQFNNLDIPLSNWSGLYNTDTPVDLEIIPGIGHEFLGWSAGAYKKAISYGESWKYWDMGSYPGANWTSKNFNDHNWKTGNAEFGYGEDDETTQIDFGNDEDNKYTTTYFRKKFTVSDLQHYMGQLVLNVIRDDGIVVHLNGKEIHRVDMPAGNVGYETLAYHTIAGELENTGQLVINQVDLIQGENVISVEIHQRTPESSDLSFDLELLMLEKGSGPIFSSSEKLSMTLSTDSVLVANFETISNCILPDTIFENTTLTIDCSPYLARNDVRVLPNVKLTVDAGVEILMPEEASIIVGGELLIYGSESLPVHIKNNNDYGANSWGQIRFEEGSSPSELHYLKLTNTTNGVHPIRDDAAISIFRSDLIIDNVSFVNADNHLIIGQYANVTLTNSKLQINENGDMVKLQYGTANISNNEFLGNDIKESCGLRLDDMESVSVNQNKFYNFYGKNSNAIDVTDSPFCFIANNFFHNITDKGISVGRYTEVNIEHNTFVNCGEGIGIKDGGSALINQNTFYNNQTHLKLFEKESGLGAGVAVVNNCIFSNAVDTAIIQETTASVIISHSIFDTGLTPSGTNIWADPKFINPNKNNFRLSGNSPAINGGLFNGNIVDIGTGSFDFSTTPSILITAIHYYPTEDAEKEFIEITNIGDTLIDLSGYEFTEAIELVFPDGTSLAPNKHLLIVKNETLFENHNINVLQWDSGKLNDEGETIILKDSNGIVQDHVSYNNTYPWPSVAAGLGAALFLIDNKLDNHFGENWEAKIVSHHEFINSSPTGYSLAPNPTSETLFIKAENVDIKSIELFDVLGKSHLYEQYAQRIRRLELDISELESGVYYLKINKTETLSIVVN